MSSFSRLIIILGTTFLLIVGFSAAWAVWQIVADRVFGTRIVIYADGAGEPIATIRGTTYEMREERTLTEYPPLLIDAVLLMEDRRFYQHRGVDIRALARAAWINAKNGALKQGGSTLTQQLARGRYLTTERTLSRKIREAMIALMLEATLSKREILERYLNEVYLGQRGILEVHGIGAASRLYLGKEASVLRPSEIALLVGMIRSPNTASPLISTRRALERRNAVLRRLRLEGRMSVAEYRRALNDPIRVAKGSTVDAEHFLDFVRQEVEANLPGSAMVGTLRVYTTLDPGAQRVAQHAVRVGMRAIDRHRRAGGVGDSAEASLVALDAETGAIRAMLGGRNYQRSQFNRAVQSRRQPGSLFKPFVYLAAFEARRGGNGAALTPATVVEDGPVSISNGRQQWMPRNFESRYQGKVRVREALELSLNAATLRVAEQVGLSRVIDQARASGIHSLIRSNPATLLGASEVSLLEVTGAYGTLARGGQWIKPFAVKKVTDDRGWVLFEEKSERRWAASPQAAFLVTSLLQGAIDRGTAASARRLGLARPAAGKTGTSNDLRDAWFVGYTPDLVAGVWVGVDSGVPLRLTAAQAALPIWTYFIERASAGHPPRSFTPPPGVVTARIDPVSGLLVGNGCSGGVDEVFIEGTEPTEGCSDQDAPLIGWLRRLFSR
jgi:penicillin-binding protein 1B